MPTSRLRRAARIILIGAPGVGKGTQTERLLKRYPQLAAISSGDLLRENVRNKTPLDGVQPYTLNYSSANVELDTAASTLPSPEIWTTMPYEADSEYRYSDHPDASFLLDGFPRTAVQMEELEKMVPVNMAVHLHTPTDVILNRISNRWVHPPSGRVYNIGFNAPKVEGRDDVTGEKLVQRDDDKPDVYLNRVKTYNESAQSLLDHAERKGILYKIEGNSSDEITPKLFDIFEKKFGEA